MDTYIMAEGRAQHEPSGLWHYVRAYGPTELDAKLNLASDTIKHRWALDGQSLRFTEVKKGESLFAVDGAGVAIVRPLHDNPVLTVLVEGSMKGVKLG